LDIASNINVKSLESFGKRLPHVTVVTNHRRLCTEEGIRLMERDVKNGSVDRIVLAGCSPRAYQDMIQREVAQSGLNPHMYEQVSIREQCAWVHPDRGEATDKAKDILAMAVARVNVATPLDERRLYLKPVCLVIGGGVAGMQAAIDLAEEGFKTYIVEREAELGGRTARMGMTFPTSSCGICCIEDCKDCKLTPKTEQVYLGTNIQVFTNSEVVSVSGGMGDYLVDIRDGSGAIRTLNVGTVIIATGSKTFDPEQLPQYGYHFPNVLTSVEFEELNVALRGECPSLGKMPKRVSFIQCVGSRMERGGPSHCSMVCCTYTIGQAKAVKERCPETEVFIHYIDLRGAYRGFEEFYREAREMGIKFVRGRVSHVDRLPDGQLRIHAEDLDLGVPVEVMADMVVLSVGQQPSDGASQLSDMFHIGLDVDGFLKEHNLRFTHEAKNCVFVAGCAQGPRGIRYSIADAKIAAANAARLMKRGYINIEDIGAIFNKDKCSGCGVCINICPYDAFELEDLDEGKHIASFIEGRCRGCGVCGSACPSGAIDYPLFHDLQILAQIDALSPKGGA
jgi:heterodisulfide reductase subunit A